MVRAMNLQELQWYRRPRCMISLCSFNALLLQYTLSHWSHGKLSLLCIWSLWDFSKLELEAAKVQLSLVYLFPLCFFPVCFSPYFFLVTKPHWDRDSLPVLPTARKFGQITQNSPNFKPWGREKIWAEVLAEFLNFPNIGRKQPELSKFSHSIHNFHSRLTESVKLS